MFEQCWSRAKSKPQMAFWFLLGAKCSTIDEWIANKAIYRISIELLIQQLLKITFSQLDGSNQQFVVGIRVCNYYCYCCTVLFYQRSHSPFIGANLCANKNQLTEVFRFQKKTKNLKRKDRQISISENNNEKKTHRENLILRCCIHANRAVLAMNATNLIASG